MSSIEAIGKFVPDSTGVVGFVPNDSAVAVCIGESGPNTKYMREGVKMAPVHKEDGIVVSILGDKPDNFVHPDPMNIMRHLPRHAEARLYDFFDLKSIKAKKRYLRQLAHRAMIKKKFTRKSLKDQIKTLKGRMNKSILVYEKNHGSTKKKYAYVPSSTPTVFPAGAKWVDLPSDL